MDTIEFKKSCQHYARKQAAKRVGLTLEEYESKIASGLKWCGGCKGWILIVNFCKDKSRPSGYSTKCNTCRTVISIKAWVKIRSDDALLEKHRSRQRRSGRRSKRYKRAVPKVPKCIRDMRWEEFEGKCAYCGLPAYSLDHIIPAVNGGTNEPWNIVPACRTCNSSKQDTDLFIWIDKRKLNPTWLFWEQIAGRVSVPPVHGTPLVI